MKLKITGFDIEPRTFVTGKFELNKLTTDFTEKQTEEIGRLFNIKAIIRSIFINKEHSQITFLPESDFAWMSQINKLQQEGRNFTSGHSDTCGKFITIYMGTVKAMEIVGILLGDPSEWEVSW